MNKTCPACGAETPLLKLLFSGRPREEDPIRCPRCNTELRLAVKTRGVWAALVLFIILIVPAGVMEANRTKLDYGWAWGMVLAPVFLIVMIYVLSWGAEFVVKSHEPPSDKES